MSLLTELGSIIYRPSYKHFAPHGAGNADLCRCQWRQAVASLLSRFLVATNVKPHGARHLELSVATQAQSRNFPPRKSVVAVNQIFRNVEAIPLILYFPQRSPRPGRDAHSDGVQFRRRWNARVAGPETEEVVTIMKKRGL